MAGPVQRDVADYRHELRHVERLADDGVHLVGTEPADHRFAERRHDHMTITFASRVSAPDLHPFTVMRFTVEQIFLTGLGSPLPTPTSEYHLVEADDVDGALADFLRSSSATLIGTVQKFPGFQAIATAQSGDAVFTLNLLPGSDVFHRKT